MLIKCATALLLIFFLAQGKAASPYLSWLNISSADFSNSSVASNDFSKEANVFRRSGFSMVKKVFSPTEIQAYRDVVRQAMQASPRSVGSVSARIAFPQDSTKDFRLLDALWYRHSELLPLVKSKTLFAIVGQFLGVSPSDICVLVDKSFFKDAGDHGTHWHIDSDANQMGPKMKGLTAWVPFQNTSQRNGLLKYVLKSHVEQRGLGMYKVERKPRDGEELASFDALDIGDVAFHHIQTRHGSHPNKSDQTREALGIVFIVKPRKFELLSPKASVGPYIRISRDTADEDESLCLRHWTCPFSIYENRFPKMEQLCQACDAIFASSVLAENPTLKECSRCADGIMLVCDDFFSIEKNSRKWVRTILSKKETIPNTCQVQKAEYLEEWQQDHITYLCKMFGYIPHDFSTPASYRTSRRALVESLATRKTRDKRSATKRGNKHRGAKRRVGRHTRRQSKSRLFGRSDHAEDNHQRRRTKRNTRRHKTTVKDKVRNTDKRLKEFFPNATSSQPPFRIMNKDIIGEVLVNAPVNQDLQRRPAFCCGTNYSAIWDKDGDILVAVVDNLFCESYFKDLYNTVMDHNKMDWQSKTFTDSRILEAFFNTRPDFPAERISVIPMMIGWLKDKRKYMQVMIDFKECLIYSLPSRIFENLSIATLNARDQVIEMPDGAERLPLYRESPANKALSLFPWVNHKSQHLGSGLLPGSWNSAVAYSKPEDLQYSQSAPHVDSTSNGESVHLASLYTLTQDTRYEASGTVLMRQKGTRLHKLHSKKDHDVFREQNMWLQQEAVSQGKSRHTGYINSSHSRWGEALAVVPNVANRIAFYPAWRPHGAWIPSNDQLSEDYQNGRTTINSFYRMHAPGTTVTNRFCQEVIAGIPIDSPQGLAEACDACSKWRPCAWYPRERTCAPSTCIYGTKFVEEQPDFEANALGAFACNVSIGVHSANGACMDTAN